MHQFEGFELLSSVVRVVPLIFPVKSRLMPEEDNVFLLSLSFAPSVPYVQIV